MVYEIAKRIFDIGFINCPICFNTFCCDNAVDKTRKRKVVPFSGLNGSGLMGPHT